GFILSIIGIIQGFRDKTIPIVEDYNNPNLPQTISIKEIHRRQVKGLLVFLGIALYYFSISILGFHISSAIFTMILLLGIAKKKPLFVVLYIGGLFFFIEYVGGILMNIKWPTGFFGV
ncbi:MAG: hypothetical protein ACTSQE_16250, partial [Candidatus Heimdallarchaeaceae archaeon]